MPYAPTPARRIFNTGARVALAAASCCIGRPLSSALTQMNRAQWLPRHKLEERLDARVAEVLRYAVDRVPFYREHLRNSGASPRDLTGVAALRAFPIVAKFTFRDGPLEPFLAEGVPEHRRLARRTSGSTGEPFLHYVDRDALPLIYASHLFYDGWFGLRPFDRCMRISPPHHGDAVSPDAPALSRLRQRLTVSLKQAYVRMTQEFVSVWEVDRDRLDAVYGRMLAFQPDFLVGYTSTLALLADFILEGGRPLPRCLRGVVTIGETLTPQRREVIAEGFRVPIINRYGLREFGSWTAQNCAETPDAFHINTELAALEILRADGTPAAPGEAGRVVITDLGNRVMPFIRYDTGDLAVQMDGAQCPCGRGFPMFGEIEGRSVESLVTPSGRTVSSIVLGRYLREGGPLFLHNDHIRFVRHYQAIQEGAARLRLLVVPDNGFDNRQAILLQQDLHRLLGGEMEVSIETAAEIPLERSGKRPLIKRAPARAGGVA